MKNNFYKTFIFVFCFFIFSSCSAKPTINPVPPASSVSNANSLAPDNDNSQTQESDDNAKELLSIIQNTINANTIDAKNDVEISYDKPPLNETYSSMLLPAHPSTQGLNCKEPAMHYLVHSEFLTQNISIEKDKYSASKNTSGEITINEWVDIPAEFTNLLPMGFVESYTMYPLYALKSALENSNVQISKIEKNGDEYIVTISENYNNMIIEQTTASIKQLISLYEDGEMPDYNEKQIEHNKLELLIFENAQILNESFVVSVQGDFAKTVNYKKTVSTFLNNNELEHTEDVHQSTYISNLIINRINDENIEDEILQIYSDEFLA